MGAVFTRRFNYVPSDDVLVEIESVNILDLTPPSPIAGIGTGTALLVGEFENGPFNEVLEVSSSSDLASTYGGFGFTRGSTPANSPAAVARKADSQVTPEYWNGNGALALWGKKFARLLVCRVDTSVGSVQFTRVAYVTGAAQPTYVLNPGEILALDIGAGSVNTTFSAGAAVRTASGGTFPTTFAGGETLTLGYDAATNFVVTFLLADQALADVVARINQYAGFTFASISGGQLRLTGIQKGTGGQVRVVASSAGSVLTQFGLTIANTAGTGNVANIAAVTFAEIKSLTETAVTGAKMVQDSQGRLRAKNTGTPGTGTITVAAGTTATALGFTIGDTSSAANATAVTIPAGTLVQNTGATVVLVTMQDVNVTADGAGPYTVKVRHAVDDGTGLLANVSTITTITSELDVGAFGVTNPQALTAALTESQIDAAYATTLATGGPTTGVSTVAKEANIIWSARHSNAIRRALRTNALYASANGCFGRVALVAPPLNSTSAAATGDSDPGVGATRDERVIYCYIGANLFVIPIAARGVAGGQGFTADGNIDQTSDSGMASILSQLNPEENPGQVTSFTSWANGIETGSNVQNFDISNYTTFRAKGIAALRMDTDDGVLIFQSGVTSSLDPALAEISRRRLDDYVGDTVARFAARYGKKPISLKRATAFRKAISLWLKGLLSPTNLDAQRIAGYTVSVLGLNTQDSLGRNLYKLRINVKKLPDFDSIAIFQTVGNDVDVDVSLPIAA